MPAKNENPDKLERTLGLPAALAIGVGTMVGAGIFVFPGIAAGYAGPAAMASFLFAGLIAMLVALSTAELATAMPESGGGYYFISRSFGPLWGMLVGLAQWAGLVFASAFYLVGFGQYAAEIMADLGLSLSAPSILIALLAALLLTGVNLTGTERAGQLQNQIVIFLTAALSIFFLYGVLNAAGLIGSASWPLPFAPKGAWPVFTTTALIFTSFLGFVQIATVAGEIKEPHRNLPRALVGSVLIVTALYVLALFVSTSVLSPARLSELGETAMVEVGRSLVGRAGGLVIMGAGLLATLSSANASILSSSRAVYALGRDSMLPTAVSRVNQHFGTPHVALLAVGLPIAVLTLLGQIEVLAEVASFLHLVIYGLICLSLIRLRRRRPLWYAPSFRIPGGYLLPVLGALASFGLLALMKPLSLGIGSGILLASLGWYAAYARELKLPPPRPPHIVPSLRSPRIVIPVEVPGPSPLPVQLLQAFRSLELFVLGYKKVPEQTSPQQASEQSGGKERSALEKIVDNISLKGANVESQLVFTPRLAQSLGQFVRDKNCQAVLTAQPIQSLQRLLVPIYDPEQATPRLATILRELAGSSGLPITLLALSSEDNEATGEQHLERLQQLVVQQLLRAGLSEKQIRPNKADVPGLAEAVTQIAGDEDLVVLAEANPKKRDRLFSTLQKDIQQAIAAPTLLILKDME